ncbi:MAG: J domain-containing protein [Myxococcales bacterium]|nr:J domain-containing protein [Myxococcales bacterium]
MGPSAWEQLGLAEGAPIDEVRRAYKRIARDLHPDLHPGAAENERRDLESRFVALTAAYRSLLPE